MKERKMRGWKTWTGMALCAIGGILKTIGSAGVIPAPLANEIGDLLISLGGPLGAIGVAHKIEKLKEE